MAGNPYLPETGGLADEIASMKRDIAALQLSAQLISASIGAGGLSIKGGAVNLYNSSDVLLAVMDALGFTVKEADGSDLMVIDGTKLRFNRADGSRQLEITPAGGLKIYAANGTTEEIVLDADGLEIDGGMARAIHIEVLADSFVDVALSTTRATVNSVDHTVPTWVTTAYLIMGARAQITNVSGGNQQINVWLNTEGTDVAAGSQTEADTYTGGPTILRGYELADPQDTVTVLQEASVSSGTNNSNSGRLFSVLVGLR